MKKILITVLTVFMMLNSSMTIYADEPVNENGEIEDNYRSSFTSDDNDEVLTVASSGALSSTVNYSVSGTTMTISGTGKVPYCSSSTSDASYYKNSNLYAFKDTVTSLVIGEGITEIGNMNFCDFSKLTSISLPSTLTTISNSFNNCSVLKKAVIPSTVTAMRSCFNNCTALEEVTLSGAMQDILGAFSGCTALKKINVSSSGNATYFKLDSTVMTQITEFNVAEGPTTVSSAYSGFTALKSIRLPSTLTDLGSYAFGGCTALESITMPGDVTFWQSSTSTRPFDGDTKVKSLTLYGSVDLPNFTAVGIHETISNRKHPFNGLKSYIESVTLSSGIKSIGKYYFNGFSKLTSITIPSTVTTIKEYAFNGCTSLAEVRIPSTVTTIEVNSFLKTTKLVVDCGSAAHTFAVNNGYTYEISSTSSHAYGTPTYTWSSDNKTVTAERHCTNNYSHVQSETVNATSQEYEHDCENDGKIVYTSASFTNSAFKKQTKEVKTTDKLGHDYQKTTIYPTDLADGYDLYECSRCHDTYSNNEVDALVFDVYQDTDGDIVISVNNQDFIDDVYENGKVQILKKDSVIEQVFRKADLVKTEETLTISLDKLTEPGLYNGNIKLFLYSDNYETFEFNFFATNEYFRVARTDTYYKVDGDTIYVMTTASDHCLNDSMTAIVNNSGATKLVIEDSILNINQEIFKNCTDLVSVTMNVLCSVNSNTFAGCGNITELKYRGENPIPNSSSLSGNQFSSTLAKTVTSVVVESGATAIGTFAFAGFEKLESVSLPTTIISIGANAFQGCTSLESILIPEGVTSVGNCLFMGCSSLETAVLPSTLTSAGGANMFANCTALSTVTFNSTVTMGSTSGMFINCSSLTAIDLTKLNTSQVTSMASMFYGCASLESIDFSVLDTGKVRDLSGCFNGCKKLECVDLSENDFSSYDDISYMFYNCDNLVYLDVSSMIGYAGRTIITDKAFPKGKLITYNVEITKDGSTTEKEMTSDAGFYAANQTFADTFTLVQGNEAVKPFRVKNTENLTVKYTDENYPRFVLDEDNSVISFTIGPETYDDIEFTAIYIGKPVEDLILNSESVTIGIDDTHQIEVTFDPEDTYDQSVTYESDDTTVATVNSKGLITGIALGKATVTVSSGEVEKTVNVTVSDLDYVVEYHLNGGTNNKDNPSSYKRSSEDITLLAATKSGYDFVGWYKDEALTQGISKIAKGSKGKLDLYAKWTESTYTVSFDTVSGSEVDDIEVTYNGTYGTLPVPTKTGYTFNAWYLDELRTIKVTSSSKVTKTEDHTLYAVYDAVNYNITYVLNGGTNTSANPKTYTILTSKTLYSPSRTGYTFKGWYSDSDFDNQVVSIAEGSYGNITLYAKWEIIEYSIFYYNLFNGTSSEDNPSTYTVETPTITLKNPSRNYYDFKYWYGVNGSKEIVITEIYKGSTGNRTVYAKWTPTKYAINYELFGGTNSSSNPSTYNYETRVDFADPSKTGYDFGGWYSESAYLNEVSAIVKGSNGEKTVYAKWTPKSVTLSFETNGGEELDEIEINYDAEYLETITENPTKEGYSFAGWYFDEELTLKVDETAICQTIEKHTLYAAWEANTYTVSFDSDGGSEISSIDVTYNTAYGTLDVPTKQNYRFDYYEDKNGNTVNEETVYMFAEDTTLKAVWVRQYTVIFMNGENEYHRETLDTNTTVASFDSPAAQGYDFAGWYIGEEEFDLETPVVSDLVITARYNYHTYTITLTNEHGETQYKDVVYMSAIGELPVPEYDGYYFGGWRKADDSEVVESDIYTLQDDLELFAKWYDRKITSSVTANIESETEVIEGTKIYLDCETANSLIYYTLDGSNPTEESAVYEDGIEITEHTCIKAFAKREGYEPSRTLSFIYDIKDFSNDYGTITDEADKALYNFKNHPQLFWTSDVEEYEYTGKAITPSIRVYFGNQLLKESKDYTLKYTNNTKVGTASIAVTGKEDYSGSYTKTFVITPKTIDVEITLSQDTFIENGKTQIPKVTVKTIIDGKTVTLKEKTDYTVTYPQRSIEASAERYWISVNGTGNYSFSYGTSYSIEENNKVLVSKLSISGIAKSYTYTGNAIYLDDIVIKNGKETVDKNDFLFYYSDNVKPGTATLKIVGQGKYVGSVTKTYVIAPICDISKATYSKLASSYAYSLEGVKPVQTLSYTITENKKKVSVPLYNNPLNNEDPDNDYFVEYEGYSQAGTATITYTGNIEKGYSGIKKVTYKITGTAISKYAVTGIVNMEFSGGTVYQNMENIVVKDSKTKDELTFGTDYTVEYQKNDTVGTATIIFTGINAYTGTIKKTFKISGKDINDISEINVPESVEYLKAGAKPEPVLTDGEYALVLNKDYTLTYKNNTAVNNNANRSKLTTVTIKGKGNYAGTVTKEFTIEKAALNNTVLKVQDIAYSAKKANWKPVVEIYGTDGKKLASKTDYEANIIYTYADDTEVVDYTNSKSPTTVTRNEGETVKENDCVPVGTSINVTVRAAGNYYGELEGSYRIVQGSLAKATVKLENQIYTGKKITPSKNQITVTVNGVTLRKTDYQIVSYENNLKVGKATLTIKGVGNYGGEKSQQFSIVARPSDSVVFMGNGAEKGTMKNQTFKDGSVKLSKNAYTRKGYTFVGWAVKDNGSIEYPDEASLTNLEDTLVLYAVWSKEIYDISYVCDDDVVNSADNPSTYQVDTPTIDLANPYRRGYEFITWYNGKNKVSQIKSGSVGDITLTASSASWKPATYTVEYNLNGGTNSKSNKLSYTKNTDFVLDEPLRTGYKFMGWFTDSDYENELEDNSTRNYFENLSLYAKWEAISYTVYFNANGGNGSRSPVTLKYDEEIVLSTSGFTSSDYHILGDWNTSDIGTGTMYRSGATVSRLCAEDGGSVTLYAQWKIPSPKSFNAIKVSDKKIKLEWSKVDNAEGYDILYSTSENGPFKQVAASLRQIHLMWSAVLTK